MSCFTLNWKPTYAVCINESVSLSGTLRLATNDPLAKPIIHGNYLNDPLDMAILLEGIQIALSFGNTTAMAKYNMTLSNQPLSACSQYLFLSNDYWRCAMRQDTGPENHQAGSCKMGPASDPMAVVDPLLRVHGIKGLRVADTSIMPQVFIFLFLLFCFSRDEYYVQSEQCISIRKVTSGNTGAPAIMIGERAAAFIKMDWGVKPTQWYGHRPSSLWKYSAPRKV